MINVVYRINNKQSVKPAIVEKLVGCFKPVTQGIYLSHVRDGGLQMQEFRSIEKEIETRFNSSGARRYGKIVSVIHFTPTFPNKVIPVANPKPMVTCEITIEMTKDEVFHLENDALSEIEREIMRPTISMDDSSELPDRMVLADGLDSLNTPLMPEEATEFDLLEDSSTPLMPLKNAWE